MSEALRYPELSEDMKARGFGAMLRIFGPGAIIASVTIGSGETVFASRGGAIFGYTLLWCFIGGGLMKFVQVYTAARYMTCLLYTSPSPRDGLLARMPSSG